ncbi:MAG: TATA-box-binding protein [Candidatus Bathyarchaeia archaeon]
MAEIKDSLIQPSLSEMGAELLTIFQKHPNEPRSLESLIKEVGRAAEEVEAGLRELERLGLLRSPEGYALDLAKAGAIRIKYAPGDGRIQRPDISIRVENVVASGKLDHELDLQFISRITPSAEYRPEVFPGLVYRLRKPKSVSLIFSSGKIVCAGAKSERQAKMAINKVVEELKMKGIVIAGNPVVRIDNIVASADLRGQIDLEGMAESKPRTIYEPEQFPALIYRSDDPKVVMLVFSSGRVICSGAKRERDAKRALYKLFYDLVEGDLIFRAEPAHGLMPPMSIPSQ